MPGPPRNGLERLTDGESREHSEPPGLFLFLILHEGSESPPPQRVAQLPERLGLDLTDALARHRKALADLFQRVFAVRTDPEA